MKKLILMSAAIATAIFTTSCDKMGQGSDLDLPSLYVYATVCDDPLNEVECYFKTDADVSFFISENRSTTALSSLEEGDRVVAGVKAEKLEDSRFDNSAILYRVFPVVVGSCETVEDGDQSDALADNKLDFVLNDFNISNGYLNMYVGYSTDDTASAKFVLVENLASDPATTVNGYLNLELRYDDAEADSDSDDYKSYENYLSFKLEDFSSQLEGKDGIVLRINTVKSGTTNIKITSSDADVVE